VQHPGSGVRVKLEPELFLTLVFLIRGRVAFRGNLYILLTKI
jgi:hypothetical protein